MNALGSPYAEQKKVGSSAVGVYVGSVAILARGVKEGSSGTGMYHDLRYVNHIMFFFAFSNESIRIHEQ